MSGLPFNTFRSTGIRMCDGEVSQFFSKTTDKAERMTRAASDVEVSEGFLNMAKAYRGQADVLKLSENSSKERRPRPARRKLGK